MKPYIVLEGPDGAGKSLQAKGLSAWLEQRGHEVVHLREPGSTPVGEALRELLLEPATGALSPVTEALLFSAARAELIQRQVRPALAAGRVVLSERCYLSTLVYQGLAQDGVPAAFLAEVTSLAHGECWPTRIFLLDVDGATGRARRGGAGRDRIEARDEEYQRRVRDGFLLLAEDDPRVEVIDACRPAEVIGMELREKVQALLEDLG